MKRLFLSGAIALLLLIAFTSVGLTVLAGTEASGNFMTTSTTIHSVMEEKLNTIIDFTSTVTYTGTLEGSSILRGTLIVDREGRGRFQGVETFTGSVNGVPRGLTFRFEGDHDLYQTVELRNIITSGSGGLALFHGELSKMGVIKDSGPVGTYIGQITPSIALRLALLMQLTKNACSGGS